MANEHPGDSIAINRRYLDSLLVEGRIVGAVHPTAKVTLLGQNFDTPVMTAALSHLKPGMPALAQAARLANAACCIGMGRCAELEEVLRTGAQIIKIVKPYADEDAILARLACAEQNGALAVGMDVEHSVNVNDDEDSSVLGLQMKLPSLDDLKRWIKATRLPFIIKGALSVHDALVCRDLGCAGVILSHHNGLMRWATPPTMLVSEIRKQVGKDFLLIVDGGIQDGFDAFKALALGADAVSIGRPLMEPLEKGGPEAAAQVIRRMTNEMKAMMVRTGSPDVKHIDPAVIHPMFFV
ncbi:MAG: alpha-hydroxy-acid oxidizing protein [Clostridia bacterium]|nr:alpha-hydroxy-acid oxidizing protein [Clostridia bacterium]